MRLFVAVELPPSVVELVAALPRPAVDGLRWSTADQWHVTLRFLGNVDDASVDALVDALGAARGLGVVSAELGPAVGRFGRRILHVPVSGLVPVADAVVRATAAFGSAPVDDRPFTGHVTLARARDRRGVDLRPLCGTPITASWPVSAVALVRSELKPTGAQHVTVTTVEIA